MRGRGPPIRNRKLFPLFANNRKRFYKKVLKQIAFEGILIIRRTNKKKFFFNPNTKENVMTKVIEQTAVALKVEDVNAELLAQWDNTSKKIRGLSAMGYTNGQIEKIFIANKVTTKQGGAIRYQHIRNVLITPIGTTK